MDSDSTESESASLSPELAGQVLSSGMGTVHRMNPSAAPPLQVLSWSHTLESFHHNGQARPSVAVEETFFPVFGDAFSQPFMGPGSILLSLCQTWLPVSFYSGA